MHQALSIEPIRRPRTKFARVYQSRRYALRRGARDQAGMTLLEMMIVLAILALVMGLLIGPVVIGALVDSRKKIAALTVDKYVNEAFPLWMNANPDRPCPEDLAALGRYMNQKSPEDPWHRPYRMLCGPNLPPEARGIAVISDGEDQRPNTQDDVRSW
jgi:prepilin-type N-terminal cleavage/methylation domain-containing protein